LDNYPKNIQRISKEYPKNIQRISKEITQVVIFVIFMEVCFLMQGFSFIQRIDY